MTGRMSRREIEGDVFIGPTAEAPGFIGRNIEGTPTVHRSSGEFRAVVERKADIPWRVTFAAMGQRFSQVSSPIPLEALRSIGLEARIAIEYQRPKYHCPALIEWKQQRIFRWHRAYRREAEEVSLDRERIGVRDVCVGGVRHCRIEPRAVTANAPMHRIKELLVCVLADTRLWVGRDVGRVHRSERELERKAARIVLAARRRVANHAIRGLREIFAAFDEAGLSH